MYVAEKLVAFKFGEKKLNVAGYCETIAPVNKSLRRHTPVVCDVFGYHREIPGLLAIINPMFQKGIKYLDHLKYYYLQENHSVTSSCDVAFI